MGRFPRLTPVRPDSRSPGAGIHNRHNAHDIVSQRKDGRDASFVRVRELVFRENDAPIFYPTV